MVLPDCINLATRSRRNNWSIIDTKCFDAPPPLQLIPRRPSRLCHEDTRHPSRRIAVWPVCATISCGPRYGETVLYMVEDRPLKTSAKAFETEAIPQLTFWNRADTGLLSPISQLQRSVLRCASKLSQWQSIYHVEVAETRYMISL